jgi:ketol-acid reductoisomerase
MLQPIRKFIQTGAPFRLGLRTMKTLNIGNTNETIYERTDFPLKKCNDILNDQYISILGYGPQGRGQSLNLKDNNIRVCVGVRKGESWAKAIDDGWEPGVDLFEIKEACDRGTIIANLLSDAGQILQWDTIKKYLTKDKTLYFSHGFAITYSEQTRIKPPDDIDVVMVAPKGAGISVREHFKKGMGINTSYAIHNDYSGNAQEKCLAMAFGIGSSYAFETSFKNETYSDLVGERCVLMGLIKGALSAQYNILKKMGHSPAEAYNETVEEAFNSLYPLINEQGMDWLYRNCSTTAQRGALDWSKTFERNLTPIIEECYTRVANGEEAQVVIDSNSIVEYKENLEEELDNISNEEIWKVGKELRALRPEANQQHNSNVPNYINPWFPTVRHIRC